MWLTFCMRSNNLYKEVVKNHGMRCKPALDRPAIGMFKKAIDDLDIKSERSSPCTIALGSRIPNAYRH